LFEPLDGQLKKDSQITIHCQIENVQSVRLIFDENQWLPEDGYNQSNGHFQKTITVPSKQIIVNIKQKNASNYTTILLFNVI